MSPSKPSIKTVKWKSSNTKVAEIDSNGVVNAKKAGTTTIKAIVNDGTDKSASVKVTVNKVVASTGTPQPTVSPEPPGPYLFDAMINGDAFFVANSGGTNYFMKSGALYVDTTGTLCTANGATIMGWQVSENGCIVKEQVSALKVMSPEYLFIKPEETTALTIWGNINANDMQFISGFPVQLNFYGKMSDTYTVKLNVKQIEDIKNKYIISLTDIIDDNGKSIFVKKNIAADGTVTYEDSGVRVMLGGVEYKFSDNSADPFDYSISSDATDSIILEFSYTTGSFISVYAAESTSTEPLTKFSDSIDLVINTGVNTIKPFATSININFSDLTMYNTNSGFKSLRGDVNGYGAGYPVGYIADISVDKTGRIYGLYYNGVQKQLGKIAVAKFVNPVGLEAVGNNMFAETKNSGFFDGIGWDAEQVGSIIKMK